MLSRRAVLIGSGSACLFGLQSCGGATGTGSEISVVAGATPSPSPTPLPSPTQPASVPETGLVIQAGDSIGVGYAAGNYAAIDHLGLSDGIAILNASVDGRTMNTGYAQRATDLFVWYDPSVTCVLLIEQGTNDLGLDDRSATSLYNDIATPFIAAAKSAGFYVALNTILPRTDGGWDVARDQQRILYNTMVRANTAGADAINDVAADPIIGDGVDTRTSPYYADQLHPTVLGQQRLAVLDAATLAPLLALAPRAKS